jgi:hypothetical protein
LSTLHFPEDLTGKRILEVAPWNGVFTFEYVRRGAAVVVALGPDDPDATGFNRTLRLLEIHNVRYLAGSAYNLPKLSVGAFDLILFWGLYIIFTIRYRAGQQRDMWRGWARIWIFAGSAPSSGYSAPVPLSAASSDERGRRDGWRTLCPG